MAVLNSIQQNSKVSVPGSIPILKSNDAALIDIAGLNIFLDKTDVENSEEFKNATYEIENILSGLETVQVKSIGYYVLLILYTIIIFIGILGNITVLMAILCKKSMRTPHNFFIAALAVSGKMKYLDNYNRYTIEYNPN